MKDMLGIYKHLRVFSGFFQVSSIVLHFEYNSDAEN